MSGYKGIYIGIVSTAAVYGVKKRKFNNSTVFEKAARKSTGLAEEIALPVFAATISGGSFDEILTKDPVPDNKGSVPTPSILYQK